MIISNYRLFNYHLVRLLGYEESHLHWKCVNPFVRKEQEDVDRLESATRPCYSLDAFFFSRSFLDILAISNSACVQGHGSSSMSRKGLRSHPA
jgi:hypothetical protein